MTDPQTPKEVAAERSAVAAAESAELDAAKKKAEFEEWQAAQERRRKEGEAALEASLLTNAEAQRAAVKDLVPDLTKVERGSTTVPESSTLFGALLASRALEDAAGKLMRVVKRSSLGDNYRVLVTTELDLASRDADYSVVMEQLKLLRRLVDRFTGESPAEAGAASADAAFGPAAAATSVVSAAAQLLPGLLSLISAKRSVTTSTSSLDDDLVMIAVAGALAGADAGGLVVAEKAHLNDSVAEPHTSWATLQAACRELDGHIRRLEDKPTPDTARIAEGKALLKNCEAALTAMITVPAGGKASPLALAAMQDAIHSDRFGGVLVVKGGAASATQLVDDRPLRFGDALSIVSTATIAYLLIDHRNGGRVLSGGLAHGVAQAHGKIGSTLVLP